MKKLSTLSLALLYLSGCATFKPMDCTRLEGAEHQKTCEQHNTENKAVADAANDKTATAVIVGGLLVILGAAASRSYSSPTYRYHSSTTCAGHTCTTNAWSK